MKQYFKLFLLLVCSINCLKADNITIDTIEAKKYFEKGMNLIGANNFDDAISAFEISSKLYKKHKIWYPYLKSKYQYSECLASIGDCRSSITESKAILNSFLLSRLTKLQRAKIKAKVFSLLGYCHYPDYTKSINYLKKCLNISLSSNLEITTLESYIGIAANFEQQLMHDSAEVYNIKSLNFCLSLNEGKDCPHLNQIYNNIGTAYFNRGNLKKAKNYIYNSLKLREKNKDTNPAHLAESYGNYAETLTAEYKYDSFEYYAHKALAIDTIRLKNHKDGIARRLNSLGVGYIKLGAYYKAINKCNEGIAILRASSNENNEMLGNLYNNIGVAYEKLGQPNKALSYHQQALLLWEKFHGKKSHPNLATINNNLGRDYNLLRDYDKGLFFYLKSLEIQKDLYALGKILETPIAHAYINVSEILRQKKDYSKAKKYLKMALDIVKKLKQNDYDHYAGACYNNLGKLYADKRNYNQALASYQKAITSWEKIYDSNHPNRISHLLNIGFVYHLKNDYEKALKKYQEIFYVLSGEQQFLEDANKNLTTVNSSFSNFLLTALHHKSLTLEKKFTKEKRIDDLRLAAKTIKNCDAQIDSLKQFNIEDRIIFRKTAKKIYEDAIRINLLLSKETGNKAYLKDAFFYSEKSKGLVLLFLMMESNAKEYAGIPRKILQQEEDLRIAISFFRNQIIETPNNNLAQQNLFEKENEYQQLIVYLEKNYKNYYQAKFSLEIKSVDFIQNDLLDSDQGLLSYFIGDSSMYLFAITKESYDVMLIPSNFNLPEVVNNLNTGIYEYWSQESQPDSLFNDYKRQYIKASYQLYTTLLQPILTQHFPKKLIILPDEELNFVSFAALLTHEPSQEEKFTNYPYLINDYQVSYNYSTTLLWQMMSKKEVADKTWLGFAPSFKNATIGQSTRNQFRQLKFSLPEIENINKLMGGDVFLKENATLENFISVVSDYRMIHLTTHADVHSDSNDLPFISFGIQKNTNKAMVLTTSDIYNLKLKAESVVMSACATNLGSKLKGEGVASLARAFAYAGAKNITATLWNAHDQAAYHIMVEYYKLLSQGLSKDEALNKSQQNYLRKDLRINRKKEPVITDLRRHPYYWAGFVSIGDTSVINLNENQGIGLKWLIAVGLLILLFLIILIKRRNM